MSTNEFLGMFVGAAIVILGGIASLVKITSQLRREREEEGRAILQEAKQYTDSRLLMIQKELEYHKDLSEGKVAELGKKIEELKEEVRRQHSQLLDLLTKVIDINSRN